MKTVKLEQLKDYIERNTKLGEVFNVLNMYAQCAEMIPNSKETNWSVMEKTYTFLVEQPHKYRKISTILFERIG